MFELLRVFGRGRRRRGRRERQRKGNWIRNGEILMVLKYSWLLPPSVLYRRRQERTLPPEEMDWSEPLQSSQFCHFPGHETNGIDCRSLLLNNCKRKSLFRIREKLKIEIGSLLYENVQHTRERRKKNGSFSLNTKWIFPILSIASSAFLGFRNRDTIAFLICCDIYLFRMLNIPGGSPIDQPLNYRTLELDGFRFKITISRTPSPFEGRTKTTPFFFS